MCSLPTITGMRKWLGNARAEPISENTNGESYAFTVKSTTTPSQNKSLSINSRRHSTPGTNESTSMAIWWPRAQLRCQLLRKLVIP
jgi:hypothetical protein